MARRFLSFASILKRGRVSDFLRPRPLASSPTDAGALLSCRKRNILSGLRVEVPGIRFGAFPQGASFPGQIVDTFLVWAELFSAFRDYISRPTHDRLVALRQTSWIPREGKKGGGKTWPASFFISAREIIPSRKRLGAMCGRPRP